jgi:nucleotide-binding universal stress UspA family protein
MTGILCPIRGGPASQGVIDLGIQLAKQTGERLHFLYVVNLDFLNLSESSRTHVLSNEMRAMGEFILLTARATAEQAGVIAECSVRQGDITGEIIELAQEIGASRVVLGRPQQGEDVDVFTTDRLRDFIQHLEEETGSKVILVDSGGEG